MRHLACFLLLLSVLSCNRDQVQRVVDPQLGYSASFPIRVLIYPFTDREITPRKDEWIPARFVEPTPFGQITWFERAVTTLDQNRSVTIQVGTLPPGNQGGADREEILQTIKDWITTNHPGILSELDAERGPGFEYQSRNSNGYYAKGIVVFRRGRIHHASLYSKTPNDPQLVNFLRSFKVDPEE
jgi:hypothetical protein